MEINNNNLSKLVFLLFAIILFGSIIYDSPGEADTKEIAYSVFMDKISSDSVVSVDLFPKEGKANWKDNHGEKFNTLLPTNDGSLIPSLREKNILINVINKEPSLLVSFLLSIASSVFSIALFIFMLRIFMSKYGGGTGGFMGIKSSDAKLFEKSDSKITFKDVAGIDECLEEVQEIVEFLKNPHKFSKLGGKIPKGCILVGPPGTGKTLLSRAMAGEAGVPFFITSGSNFVEMFVGLGASRIRSLFEEAKKSAPCIIFIDEIDAIGKSRGGPGLGGGHDEREQTLNQLLVEMDGFEGNEGIVVIAATNRQEVLDKALLRPGRFDRQIYVPLPDLNGRESILKIHLSKVQHSSDVDIKRIAKGTPGFTGADLSNLVNEAALLAGRNDQKLITMADFEKSKDKLFLGKERKSLIMSEDERRLVAYHEGGHALVSLFVEGSDPVHKVTIIPHGRALGLVLNLPEKDSILMNITQLKARIAIAMGGRVSEELILGPDKITNGASSDIVSATNIARKMVVEWGMSKNIGEINYSDDESGIFKINSKPQNISNLIEEEVKLLIEEGRKTAESIIKKHKKKLDLIAQALLKFETITGEHLNQILKNGKLDEEKKGEVIIDEVNALPI